MDILIGIIVVAVIAGLVYYSKSKKPTGSSSDRNDPPSQPR